MAGIGYIMRCIKAMDYRQMLETVGEIHRISGKNRVGLFFDVIYCGLRYGAGYRDYRLNEWWTLNAAQRKTYVTRGINNSIIKHCNDPAYYHLLNDKIDFNRTFERFLGRKWLYLKEASEEEFAGYMEGLEEIVAKPVAEACGRGVEKLRKADFESISALYHHLVETERYLVEEVICQHETISQIYPDSVNTLRIVTLTSDDGEPHLLYAFIRIGNGGRVVDNINAGGMAAPIDLETGVIDKVAFDKDSRYYEKHPQTGSPIVGVRIPMWREATALVLEAAKMIPQLRYVGWDVAITPNGPIFVEGNQHPGHDILQMPPHVPDKIGMLPRIRQFIKL